MSFIKYELTAFCENQGIDEDSYVREELTEIGERADNELAAKEAEITRLERNWRTLKAESGYRTTIDSMGNDDQQLKQLMDDIESRPANN